MKAAIALSKDQKTLYPGPFGHAPYFALVEDCRLVEVIENPYARDEGGDKPKKLKALLAGAEVWVGKRFGHDHHPDHPPPPAPHRKAGAPDLAGALEELGCGSTTSA